ncbi:GlxA family transcriptional regulator [Mucilaginibacter auburnensis]|uniref:Transcriptional regulator GlxA family with amidase domain n=1 Tax=Mucilaginibacter auburnensis TaxID=1457233 RepID=A0A2H9VVT1_9SPHI|nr:helix-turn-helix domain-containing protein [Mucilaginibacter auburnensis]PJJ84925.1 transcriptional regulator GlxA family with amidase domain [Mucilaginibacter auburnensis]
MKNLGVLLTHNYRLLSVAAILDVFDSVNSYYKADGSAPYFNITLIAPGLSKTEFDGYKLDNIGNAPQQDIVFVPAFRSDDIPSAVASNQVFIPWLQQQFSNGAEIACVCTGAFLLGATGLLNGKPATTHVDACPAFNAIFPAVKLQPEKVVTGEGGLYTSGGSTSSFHLMLHLLQKHCGKEMAVRIAKLFSIDMDREQQTYFSTFYPAQQHNDQLVAMAQKRIEEGYRHNSTIEDLIKEIPASRRNILRRFKQVTGVTPIEYLQKTRIEAAKKLLIETNQQMTEVMLNSGYNDPKAFRKVFRKAVGMTPTGYREKFYMG